MIYLVVGKNGSGKSYFVVKTIKDFADQNPLNAASNAEVFSKNQEILTDRNPVELFSEFATSLEELRKENPKVYANYETPDDLVTDIAGPFTLIQDNVIFNDYFKYHIIYNDFIKHLTSTTELKLQLIKPVHKLYADINGLKIPGVELPLDDWRKSPLGSKIFYDEFQDRPEYLFEGNKPSKNPMILELSKIRHYDIDLYLITPDSENLHKSLRKIVHVMYFVKRPHGNPKCCSIYSFDQFLANPRAAADSKREPKKYVAYELLPYKKSIQNLYTSAANHSSMAFQIPWKWIRNAAFILTGFIIIIAMLFKIPIFGFFVDAVKGMFGSENSLSKLKNPTAMSNTSTGSASNTSAATSPVTPEIQKKIDLCMKDFGWNAEQCREAFDKPYLEAKQQISEQTSSNTMDKIVANYSPSKPFEPVNVQYEVTAKPVFSGCMKKGNKYVAYTQQGTILHDVSSEDCRRVIENGDRPFNYFQQPQQAQNQQPLQVSQQPQQQKLTSLDAEFLAKYQQAKSEGLI